MDGTDSGNRVLLVEDDPDRVRLTRDAVGKAGLECRLTVATDGREALDRIENGRGAGTFDLILVDLGLPELSGHEVCRRIRRAHGPHLPLVVVTSSDEERDIQASYEAGANGHVTKAVDFQRFRRELEVLLRYWLSVNRTPRPSSS